MKTSTRLASAVSAALAGGTAQAAYHEALLDQFVSYSNGGSAAANASFSAATWIADDVTGQIIQTGGVFNAWFKISPTTTLYRLTATGLVLGGGGAASATSYSCIEGNFGNGVGASLCGNYNFGANYINESTLTQSGTAVTRTLHGDDVSTGLPMGLADLDGMTISYSGPRQVFTNRRCGALSPASCTDQNSTSGYTISFLVAPETIVMPVPAATWLFGSALATLGVVRRRAQGREVAPRAASRKNSA